MWATKLNSIKEEKDEGNKELDSVFHKEDEVENFSGGVLDADRMQSCPSLSMMKDEGAFNMLNDKLNKLTKTVEEFISDNTTWKKMMDEDAKSRKAELKKCLEIQKDTVKSYLSMKKKNSAIEKQFERIYGKKFFDLKE